MDKQEDMALKEMDITDNLIDLFNHAQDLTTSDLQGAIQAQVHNAIVYGRKARGICL